MQIKKTNESVTVETEDGQSVTLKTMLDGETWIELETHNEDNQVLLWHLKSLIDMLSKEISTEIE